MHFRGTTQFVAASSALIDAMSVTMPPTAARKAAINTFIRTLQNAGIWDLLDVMWVTAAHSPEAALLNWKSPGTFTGVATNSPTWQADRGYTGNGTTSRIQTGWIPSTNGVNYTLNAASMWVWITTDVASANGDIGVSSDASANRVQANTRTAGNVLSIIINSAANATPAAATSIGFSGTQRTAANNQVTWKNGVSLGTAATNSSALPTSEVWLCGVGASQSFSTRQVAFGAFGATLAGLEAQFYAAVLAYMQTVGAA